MSEMLNVTAREQLGTKHTRRLRRSGQIPAVLYGHGEANVNLAIPASEIQSAIRHGSKLVDIRGAVSESCLIRQVQWDPFGVEILHLDLTRVSADEAVHIVLPVELKGEAPGLKEGGIVEHFVHEVEIECPVRSLPEKLVVSLAGLRLGQAILASQIVLPEGAKLLSDEDAMIAHCVTPLAPAEPTPGVPTAEGIEPEVITRKPKEEEAEDA